jgi:CSLREA domain-containing protein
VLRGLPLLLVTAALAAAPSSALASTITVDIRTDVMAADGHCSLREAIQAANARAAPFPGAGECAAGDGNDTVVLPSGTFKLTIAGAGEDANATGNLDVLDARLTISGAGAGSTTIDANHLDRALDVLAGRIVRVQGVRVTGGTAPSGVAGANQIGTAGTPGTPSGGDGSGGNGGAGSDGGGIRNAGSLSVVDSIVSGNAAGAGGKGGLGRGGDGAVGHIMAPGGDGGVGYGGRGGKGGSGGGSFSSGALTLLRTAVTQNAAGPGGAGSTGTGGQGGAAVDDSSGNGGAGGGGAGGVGGLGQGGAGGATTTSSHTGGGGAGYGGSAGAGGAGGGVFAANRVAITSTLVAQNRTGAGAKGGDGAGSVGGVVTAVTGGNLAGSGGVAYSGDGGPGGAGGGILATVVAATNVTVAGNATAAGASSGAATGGTGGGAISSGTPGNGGNATTGAGGAGGAGGGLDSGNATIRNATITGNTLGVRGDAGAATAGRGGSAPSGGTPGSPGTAAAGLPGIDGAGGALRAEATTTLANSIVAGNALLSCDGTVVDGGHDIAVPDVACPGANVDPLLAALADNGGPSRTQALLPRSPAIDALPASGANCPATDERGVPRPQGPACDIGAYEVGVGAAAGSGGVVLARLTRLGLSPKSFRAAAMGASAAAAKRRRRTGTTVTYTLNEAATVRFSLVRPRGGRRAGRRCVKPTKRNPQGARLHAAREGQWELHAPQQPGPQQVPLHRPPEGPKAEGRCLPARGHAERRRPQGQGGERRLQDRRLGSPSASISRRRAACRVCTSGRSRSC